MTPLAELTPDDVNAHVRATRARRRPRSCARDGFARGPHPHRARARHALCRPGLRDHHRLRRPTARGRRLDRAAHELRRAAQGHVRPHARRRSRSRSSPIGCAASASCRRSRCRSSSATGATLDGRAARDAARALRRQGASTARSISASSSTSACTLPGPAILDQFDCTTVICPGQVARVDEWKNLIVTRWRRMMHHRRRRSRSGEGEPRRHRAGDAELAVPHRLLHHRARIAGRLLRADERATARWWRSTWCCRCTSARFRPAAAR